MQAVADMLLDPREATPEWACRASPREGSWGPCASVAAFPEAVVSVSGSGVPVEAPSSEASDLGCPSGAPTVPRYLGLGRSPRPGGPFSGDIPNSDCTTDASASYGLLPAAAAPLLPQPHCGLFGVRGGVGSEVVVGGEVGLPLPVPGASGSDAVAVDDADDDDHVERDEDDEDDADDYE